MIRGFCFDMDGVLFDTERQGGVILQEAAKRQGAVLSDARWHSLLGVSMAHTRQALLEWFHGRVDPDRFLEDWRVITLAERRRHGMPLKPGAREVLDRLRQRGMKLALCTSNAADVVAEYLRLAGWEGLFDQVVTGNMVTRCKPDPEIYLTGARLLGLTPAECVGIEDSVNGVRSVRAAGMVSVMIPDVLPYTEELAPYVDLKLDNLRQLEAAILSKE